MPLFSIAAVATGMVAFAVCAHQGLPWRAVGAGGLVLAGVAIARPGMSAGGTAELLGLDRFSWRVALLSVVGLAMGAGAGFSHRYWLGLPLQPSATIHAFVVVACVIGATEELLYRGWMFGQLRSLGWPGAVLLAAAAHAAYKTALFAWPAVPTSIDLTSLFLQTVVGGVALGLLREYSRSVVPPVLAHVAFDFVVYRSLAEAPWWVWG